MQGTATAALDAQARWPSTTGPVTAKLLDSRGAGSNYKESSMRVSLRKEDETSGLFRKTTEYVLYVKVELTPEERAAIKSAGIDKYILMEYSYKGLELNWEVGSVVYASDKGSESRFVASDAITRNDMEQHVKEQLKALKSQIEGQIAGGTGSQSYEL